nr:MAG TPA: hypothetical protein [Caudoviricetes sp.]
MSPHFTHQREVRRDCSVSPIASYIPGWWGNYLLWVRIPRFKCRGTLFSPPTKARVFLLIVYH